MSKFRSRPTLAEAENPSAASGGAVPNPAASGSLLSMFRHTTGFSIDASTDPDVTITARRPSPWRRIHHLRRGGASKVLSAGGLLQPRRLRPEDGAPPVGRQRRQPLEGAVGAVQTGRAEAPRRLCFRQRGSPPGRPQAAAPPQAQGLLHPAAEGGGAIERIRIRRAEIRFLIARFCERK